MSMVNDRAIGVIFKVSCRGRATLEDVHQALQISPAFYANASKLGGPQFEERVRRGDVHDGEFIMLFASALMEESDYWSYRGPLEKSGLALGLERLLDRIVWAWSKLKSDRVRVGDVLSTVEQLDALPPRTILQYDTTKIIEKTADGWASPGWQGTATSVEVINGGKNTLTVIYLPEDES